MCSYPLIVRTKIVNYLYNGITGISCNSTVVVFVPGHLDVTFLTPIAAPGVFDKPVVLTIFCAISDNSHTMVATFKVRFAICSVVNTAIVEPKTKVLETIRSMNSYRDRSLGGNSNLQSFFTGWNPDNSLEKSSLYSFPGFTGKIAVHPLVGIRLFSVNISCLKSHKNYEHRNDIYYNMQMCSKNPILISTYQYG